MPSYTNFHNKSPLQITVGDFADFISLTVKDKDADVTFFIKTLEDALAFQNASTELVAKVVAMTNALQQKELGIDPIELVEF